MSWLELNDNRALLVISDFHLGPGAHTGEHESFDQDEQFCKFLEFYAHESNYSQMSLIINGDFFDSIQVAIDGILPSRVYESHALLKIKKIADGHRAVFNALNLFAASHGRQLIFLVGNHDPSIAFQEVQNYLKGLVGENIQFLSEKYIEGTIEIAHGNNWDSANKFENGQLLSQDSSGEYIKFPWGTFLVIDFVTKVRKYVPDIDRIKPLGAFIRWSIFNRKKDAALTLLLFAKFFIKYRFRQHPDQRFTLLRLIKILRGTCYSCDFVDKAQSYFSKKSTGVLIAGHTHRAVLKRFSHNQVYVNSGTWLPILLRKNEIIQSYRHRTFVLVDRLNNLSSPPRVRLMEWLDENIATQYLPSFEDTHMHPKMGPIFMRSLVTATIVWPLLMMVNHYSQILAGDLSFIFTPTSLFTFLIPFTVAFVSRMSNS